MNILTVTQDGTVYVALGGGIMGNGQSQDALRATNSLLNRVRRLEERAIAGADGIAKNIERVTGKRLRVLELVLHVKPDGLAAYERTLDVAINFDPPG